MVVTEERPLSQLPLFEVPVALPPERRGRDWGAGSFLAFYFGTVAAFAVLSLTILAVHTTRAMREARLHQRAQTRVAAALLVQGEQLRDQRAALVALIDLYETQGQTLGALISSQESQNRAVATLARGQGYNVAIPPPHYITRRFHTTPRANPKPTVAQRIERHLDSAFGYER
jgi:hypothetical protein